MTQAQAQIPKLKTHKVGSTRQSIGACIYGRGGAGKTTLLGTMPGKGLVIDVPQVEGGTMVLSDHMDRIEEYPCTEWNDVEEAYRFLMFGSHDFKWVAVDSITAFAELARRKTIKERPLTANPHQVTQQEWGAIGSLVADLIYKFRLLKQHTVWIAQQKKFGNDDDPGPKMIGPDVSPYALARLIPSMLVVGHLTVDHNAEGKQERRLLVDYDTTYYAKHRAVPGRNLPRRIANPNLSQILRYVSGLEAERPEAAQDDVFVIG